MTREDVRVQGALWLHAVAFHLYSEAANTDSVAQVRHLQSMHSKTPALAVSDHHPFQAGEPGPKEER